MVKLTAVAPIIITAVWLEEDTEKHRNNQDMTL
jgi:predicted outer membrane lipoprotein